MTVSPLGVLAPIIEGEAVLPLPGIRLRFVPIGEFPALRREAISVTICQHGQMDGPTGTISYRDAILHL